jgi:hypothetical protein
MKLYRLFSLRLISTLSLFVLMITSCAAPTPLPSPTPTAMITLTKMPTVTPTVTLVPTPTAIRTPPVLPGLFETAFLNPVDTPHTYIQDTCQYLRDKWSSSNSAPGTVVMVIMFHSIVSNEIIPTDNQITEKTFHELIGGLMNAGFEAITTTQLVAFLEHNAKIPQHSVLLVVDDRHHAQYFDTFFRSYWEVDGWSVVNAYISASRDNLDLSIFKEQEILNAEGWVDYQAHGVDIIPMWPGVSDSYISNNLLGSIEAFKLHFNKTPIAIIWPGGGFSARSVEIARQLGYQLGFTTNARGPLMFNWIPLGDKLTDVHGGWQPEGPLNDPLMLLPRYWDTDALIRLNEVVKIGQAAADFAGMNKTTELEYFDIICAPQYGQLP